MSSNNERIVDIDVSKEMRESFLEYSYSVIYSRALPDARDGLKPVQRRIIYQMGEMGLRPDRGHVKSARVTGEVMGKLHPHGDGAIYDALVRMSQSFSLRLPLIDGHGNFGSLDDGPAAARYTEARLAQAALLLNESLDEDVVDFEPNYDAQLTEPAVLPAAFPNLLVNGASGIAVGMATNMAPHNLREVVAALQLLLKNPDASLEEIMEVLPGPDLPSGGIALVGELLTEAYNSGRGSFKMRARMSVESVAPRRTGLVVTELPYLVGPERVIDKIRDAVNAKKLEGIHNVVDLTDRENGLRLVIELKTGYDPSSVMEALYRFTPLEENFGVNNVALVEGRPQQMPLKALLSVYLSHRLEVTRRRSKNRMDRRKARLHLLEGLAIAVLNLDEVIEVIRSSDTAELARQRLMQIFDLSELQAEHILELRLRRLTRFSVIELETEADTLRKEIAELEALLANPTLLKTTVSRELEAVAEKYGDARRTTLIDASGVTVVKKNIAVTEIADSPTNACMNALGQVFKTETIPQDQTASGYRFFETSLRSDVGLILSNGAAVRVHVSDLPSLTPGVSGNIPSAEDFIGVKDASVVGMVPWKLTGQYALGTAQGTVKRIEGELPDRDEVSLISLKELDQVVGIAEASDESEIAFVSSMGNLLVFDAKSVRPQGLPASGMAGINLTGGRAIYFGSLGSEAALVTCSNSSLALGDTDPGSAKVTKLSAYPRKGRGSMGVRCHRFLKGEDQLYFAKIVGPEFAGVDLDGNPLELPGIDERRDGSGVSLGSYLGGVN
ncbi:MAG: DNA topoisomerase IV subunit A [Aquiluna sp.]|nr:DNA topoisomerase IV subunit A [Aquiluna sp.]MCF8545132.1 DNA topoisomerase IV subunit A [Aquiluna sp.]